MLNKSDNQSHLGREEYPLPPTVDGICSLVRNCLEGGLVQRVHIENGRPVVIYRELPEGEFDEGGSSIDGVLRNMELLEYAPAGYASGTASPFEMLFDIFYVIASRGLVPMRFFSGTGGRKLLERWLMLEERGLPPMRNNPTIIGVPLTRLLSMPEETLILCGAPYADSSNEEIALGVKITLEVRDEQPEEISETVDRVRDNPRERPAGTGKLEEAAGGSSGDAWVPPNFLGTQG
jgi:hypothetical protein